MPKDKQEKTLHRLKIAKGHLEKVMDMIEKDEYCIDILTQSQAVQKAIKETDVLILENHLEGCVVDHIRKGKIKATISEIIKVFRKS